MSFVKIYVHYVWSTKNRIKFLKTPEIRKLVWDHIKDNALQKNIYVDHISGYSDHCHCLISLGKDQTVQKIIQLIKGESAYWINRHKVLKDFNFNQKFQWQDEYFAISVSQSKLHHVRAYIRNQENHHKIKSYQEECLEIKKKFGFED
ncbi:MAG: IS200/IS605 family transposase [Psychroflexus maritimus]